MENEKEEIFEENSEELEVIQEAEELLPKMNVNVQPAQEERKELIEDETLVEIYNEIMQNIREDRKEVGEFIDKFADMVINEGESTSASKEALVNLVKTKTDMSDKMAKIAELMTRIKLRERDTFPKYLSAQQNNTYNIGSKGDKRKLIAVINKAKKNKMLEEGKKDA